MTKQKTALIVGISGQDGAYLVDFLLKKGYHVHGLNRRTRHHSENLESLIYEDIKNSNRPLTIHYGDVTDAGSIFRIIKSISPDEIYNLAAQSNVELSFDSPQYTADVTAMGALRVLEAVKVLGLEGSCRIYQSSPSAIYGLADEKKLNENSKFNPQNPYATAKLYSYWITTNYRDNHGLFASNGILFNHESPLRGQTSDSRRITSAAARISLGLKPDCLYVGNLEAERDWGHASDYVEGIWKILQHETADDFVLATGTPHTVRDFIECAFKHAGMQLRFSGSGENEIARCADTGDIVVRVDTSLFNSNDWAARCGDASKAKAKLNWSPSTSFDELCKEMVQADIKRTKAIEESRIRFGGVEQIDIDSSDFLTWYLQNVA